MTAATRRLLPACFILALVLLAVPRPATSQPTPGPFDGVRKLLQDAVDRREIAGGVALVLHRGEPVCFEAVGLADVGAKKPMARDTIFRIASMTKPVTSSAVLLLADEGKLQLTDPVSKYLPEFKSPMVAARAKEVSGEVEWTTTPAKREITIHDLLTHTSGLTYGFVGHPYLGKRYEEAGVSDGLTQTDGTLAENVRRLAGLPLAHDPGSAWEYGLSTDVLGRVVEVASGKGLDEFFRERIFAPLGMTDTYFFLPAGKCDRLAALYTPGEKNEGIVKVGGEPRAVGSLHYSASFHYRGPKTYFSGGAGLVSTARDYGRFLRMLLNRGELDGKRILKAETVGRMTRNQIGDLKCGFPIHGDGFGYGVGVVTGREKGATPAPVGSYSWGGIFNTFFWVDPKNELVGVVLTQLYPFGHLSLWKDFQTRVYAALDREPGGKTGADGRFVRLYWFERGVEAGNLDGNKRFRVNAPEVAVHPEFGGRHEATSSGMLQILVNEDPRRLAGAELYLELWGGHPGTANKRVTPNGRTTYRLPDAGGGKHCTHLYPIVSLKPSDLVNGHNALQFACDQGTTFWGHFIVDNACLRAVPKADADLKKPAGFTGPARVVAAAKGETIELSLAVPAEALAAVAAVDYFGHYRGYDENGSGRATGWHGFTKKREPVAHLGTAREPPFAVTWDTSMLPAQAGMAVRAVVRFKDESNLVYETPATGGLRTPDRGGAAVGVYLANDLPGPFWSRAKRKLGCTIPLDVDPAQVERAELHVVVWDGGAGTVKDYFTLNGRPLAVAGSGHHDVIYTRLELDPKLLRNGPNRIELLSDTEHHGIEVLWPGPALMVRTKR